MFYSKQTLLLAATAALHSFTSVHASAIAVAEAAAPTITLAPSPTVEKRDGCEAAGKPGTPILSTLHYEYTALPQQVYPFAVLRGPQTGYNICNNSTEGPNSMCQTLVFNGPDDFCLWGSPQSGGSIGNLEAEVVAYCTKPGHGARVFPEGSISGLQWVKTSAYIQVTGFIKNSALGLIDGDQGGELDPHGCDLQGNPLGGVVFSNGIPDSDGKTLKQVFNWNTFVGSGQFCFKACFNSVTSPDYCENRFDTIGCQYNMPSAAKDGVFESCDSDLQDIVGTYTENGVVKTLLPEQPADYQPRIPASRNCKQFQSTELFAGAPAATQPAAGSSQSGSASGNTLPTSNPSNTQSGVKTTPSATQSGNSTGAAMSSIINGDAMSLLALVATLAAATFGMVMV